MSSGRSEIRERSVRRDLEGLRAVAVLGVVVYHCQDSWLPGGFVGVDVFFVLSGFFITGQLLREATASSTIDLLAFWGRRARRLLPAAAVVLIATVVAALVFVDSIDAHRFAQDGRYAALFSVNWHYAALGTSYLADPDPSPLVHYWSLGVEEQFYLIWPGALLILTILVRRSRPSTLRRCVGGVALVASIGSFLLAWRLTAGRQPYAYFATYSRVWQLGLGAVLAATAGPLARLPLSGRTAARWLGVGAVVGFYVRAPLDIVYPGWVALVPTLGAALVIAAGLPATGRHGPAAMRADPVWLALRMPLAQLLGRYSYGWYLWHWPPLVLLPLIVHHRLGTSKVIACAVISLGCAVASYHLLEHPVRASRRLAARRGRWSLALGAAIVVAALGASQLTATTAANRTAGSRIESVPGEQLVPQPGAAVDEPNPARSAGCEASLTTTRDAPECRRRPDTGHGDVVLVGDSHAAQWMPAVEQIARGRDLGLRVWTRQSCPFADVTKVIDGAPGTACDRWRENVVQRLVAARPSLVIVASYASRVPSLYDRANGNLVKGAAATALFETGLRRELDRLRAAGLTVMLIRDNPSFDTAGPQCVLENPHRLAVCSATERHALPAAPDRDAARAVPGVHVLDLTDRFCSSGRCSQVLGSILAYRDGNHLTLEMVAQLTPRLAAAIDQLAIG